MNYREPQEGEVDPSPKVVAIIVAGVLGLALIIASCSRGQAVSQQEICAKIMEQGDAATKLAAVQASWTNPQPLCKVPR